MSNQANLKQFFRRIPPKWALGLIGVVLVYWMGQPILTRSFGWNLPTIASILDSDQSNSIRDPSVDKPFDMSTSTVSRPSGPLPPAPLPEDGEKGARRGAGALADEVAREANARTGFKLESIKKPTIKSATKASQYNEFLTEVGPDRYRSPAGLLYTRGSEQGHRLKHLAKHLEDQPTRPGPHGVFDGDLMQVLGWIDEAYQKAMDGDRTAVIRKEGESTIYEVPLDRTIGYVGGSDGKRKGNPSTRRLRLVVIGQNVITAFPY